MLRREQSSSFTNSISMTLVHKREKDERCVLTCEKSERKEGAIEQVLDLDLAATLKNLGFSWPVHSSLASSAKLDIVKVDKT